MINERIILYAVPEIDKVSGGPATRITQVSKVIAESNINTIIQGKSWNKLKQTLLTREKGTVYVESSTNRVKLIDIICLFILRIRNPKLIVYIRDVYIQVFPEKYKGLRKSITKVFNRLSNLFYVIISTSLAFPTMEMGKVFSSSIPKFLLKPYFALPPGTYHCDNPVHDINNKVSNKLRDISFLYLGGLQYVYSGFESFLDLAEGLSNEYKFHILSKDDVSNKLIERNLQHIISYKSLTHNEVISYFDDANITFVIHPRPRNTYDDITYPIKLMDCISCGVPFISLPHIPIVELVGNEYFFFINELNNESIINLINTQNLFGKYKETLLKLEKVSLESSYKIQLRRITTNF